VATLQGKAAEAVLPVGEYRCSTLHLSLRDPATGQAWGYLFSDSGAEKQQWHKLARGSTLVFDPVGQLALTVPTGDNGTCIAGKSLHCRPGLFTGEGLLITTAYHGRELPSAPSGNGPQARIVLIGATGAKLNETSSGFA
jgi:hypothetical protein